MTNATLLPIYNATNATLDGLLVYANVTTNYLAGPMIMSSLWLVIFFSLSQFNKNDSGLVASTLTLLIATMLSAFNSFVSAEFLLLNLAVLIIFAVLKPMQTK